MVTSETARKLALSFQLAEEQPHFEKTSFRVHKKIFATLDLKNEIACVKLTEIDQSVFCAGDKNVIYPVPNSWGRQGWTYIVLKKVRKDLLHAALEAAYTTVLTSSPKKK